MKKFKYNLLSPLIIIFIIQSCATKPPESPDNICLILKKKRVGIKQLFAVKKDGRSLHMY